MDEPGDPDAPRFASEFRRLGSATLAEVAHHAAWIRGVSALTPGTRVAGRAWCARAEPMDNLAAYLAVASAPPGAVLVVDAAFDPERAYWGAVLTHAALARGVAALVLLGRVRDVADIRGLGFPIFAAGTAPRGPVRRQAGTLVDAVSVPPDTVRTGDWVVGDDDGVIAFEPGSESLLVRRGVEREEGERLRVADILAGAPVLDPDQVPSPPRRPA